MTAAPAIVFIHDRNSSYLRYSLAQSKLSNPNSRICLIGNEDTACFPFAEHFHLRDYITNAVSFSGSYLHLSPNDKNFELFCLARWFILRDFMILNKLEQVVYLDSDIMLYTDLQQDPSINKAPELALCGVAPPILINSLTVLDEFCRLLETTYDTPEGRCWLGNRYEQMQKSGLIGGICDMTFWEILRQGNPDRVLDLSLPDGEGAMYDRNIQQSDGFLMQDDIKQITWRRGFPYCTRPDGSMVRIKGLHFHGEKARMKGFFHDWLASLSAP